MPNFNVFQPNKQQNTATQAPPQNGQENSSSTHQTTVLSPTYQVLDDSFLRPDSDDEGIMNADGDEYELTDDELLDYARPGRRRPAEKQALVSASSEDEEKGKGPASEKSKSKDSAEVLQVGEVRLNLKGKKDVALKKPGLLGGLKK